jgi:prepilin-type N-terminal cleavage/methylation domain-containing protein
MVMRKNAKRRRTGFTLIELLIGMTIMLVVILATLYIYSRSNKVSVDQQQYAEVQHNVRAGMYFISRDLRMTGVNMPAEFMGYFLQGVNNDTTDTAAGVTPDRLKLIGNMDDPLLLRIQSYNGTSDPLTLENYSFEQNPYLDSYYLQKFILILPNPASGCRLGQVKIVSQFTHNLGGGTESLLLSPATEVILPGNLSGNCSGGDYTGGSVVFANVKEYWLDATGHYPGLTAGQNGYIGDGHGGILYVTSNGVHMPLAQNIENLQFQYNGDFDNVGQHTLDGFQNWPDSGWTITQVGRIRQIRLLILGRTPNRMVSVSGNPPGGLYLYRRPALADTSAAAQNDMHKRFQLESTANIRNMSLSTYNTGER